MTKRPTPPVAELVDALGVGTGSYDRLGDPAAGVLLAVPWHVAESTLKRRFATTYTLAGRWLTERATEPDSPIAIMRTSGRLSTLLEVTNEGPRYGSELAPGWTDQDCLDIGFDQYGRPALVGSRSALHDTSFVLLRSALEPLLAAVRAARAERNAEYAAKEDAKRAEFYASHGDSMAVIEKWLANLDRSGVHPSIRDGELFRVSNIGGDDLWGAPGGGLSIELHGSEIAALARLIEETGRRST